MKLINYWGLMFCSTICCLTTACGDSDDSPQQITSFVTPNTKGNIVKAIEYDGNFGEAYNWNFTYSKGKLTSASGTYYCDSTDYEFPYKAQISYLSDNISITTSVTNSNATTSDRDRINTKDIVLGSNGLISSMKVGQYRYSFSYNFDGYLTKWIVEKEGTGLPGTNEIRQSYANLYYEANGSLSKIVYTDNDAAPQNTCTITFTYYGEKSNINGLLPEGVIKEIGFFGFEYLYYAGALGKSPLSYLVKTSNFEYSYEGSKYHNFTINYTYAYNYNNDVNTCYYNYNSKYADVKYKY